MQSSTMPSDQLDIVPAPAFDEGDDDPPDPGHARTSRCRRPSEIGRASCRERV